MSSTALLPRDVVSELMTDGVLNTSSSEKRSRDEDTVLEPKSHSNKLSKTASQSNEASELPPSKESSSPVSSTPQTGPPGNYCDSNGPSFESREDSPFGKYRLIDPSSP
ncbi:hypothetical protein FRC14_004635 [Serendipita sp. 396]|nr:hypothetical protein FRC14_004635 [Serendipita sp. 396]